jgi:hypothetical protein
VLEKQTVAQFIKNFPYFADPKSTHIQNVGKHLDIVKKKWFSKVEDM